MNDGAAWAVLYIIVVAGGLVVLSFFIRPADDDY